MDPTSDSTGSASRPQLISDVLEETNKLFTRLRHSNQPPSPGQHACLEASHTSVAYIRAFWPHVASLIDADPRKLGMSVLVPVDGSPRRLGVDDIRRSFVDSGSLPSDEQEADLITSVLAPLMMMVELLNSATASWAEQLAAGAGQCPLSLEVDPSRFVSLRTLLPHREEGRSPVGANAPTLVIGGTTTALIMSWNLLYQLPRAYRELEGKEADRQTIEQLWENTRELIFRIGSGSLASFVALASACSSDSEAVLWDEAHGLGLASRGGRHVWTMNSSLVERFQQMFSDVRNAQQDHYVGCAALYARTDPLPLATEFAGVCEAGKQPTVFAEFIRWITAVARAEYFPRFQESVGLRGS